MLRLPIDDVLPQLLAQLQSEASVVLKAPTGAGKTTRVPPAVERALRHLPGRILVLEPRRLAALTAARRIAAEAGLAVGEEVGFHIRFERQVSASTRLLVATEGIALRMLQDDPFLQDFAGVIFDEFHERSLLSDLALALLRQVQRNFRPELRLVVMSATLDPAPVARFLGCGVVESQGRTYPVEIGYQAQRSREPLPRRVAAAVREAAGRTSGHILAFLPGVGEIRRTRGELADFWSPNEGRIFELHGTMPADEQERVLRPCPERKIILATNVAETSVTVEGVAAVVDSGWARVLRFDPSVGLNRLQLKRISRASADQRAGRAGRLGPGLCLRLWTAADQSRLAEQESPEIRRVDLAGAVLQLLAWGEADPERFPWFEPPRGESLRHAQQLLWQLGATDQAAVTPRGRRMVRLPVHPRIAALLLAGREGGCREEACLAAAMLSERDPFQRVGGGRKRREATASDVADRLAALLQFQETGQRDTPFGRLEGLAVRQIFRVCEQLSRELAPRSAGKSAAGKRLRGRGAAEQGRGGPTLSRALLAAFPDRVARRRSPSAATGVLVGGRGVRLADESGVRDGELFLCVDVEETDQPEALVRQAVQLAPEWLASEHLRSEVVLEFDEAKERVVALQQRRYLDLLLDQSPAALPDAALVSARLAAEAARRLSRALALDAEPVAGFLARVRCLRDWRPEWGLPEFSEEELKELLPALCAGHRSLAELRRLPLVDWLRQRLTSAQLQALDREAPERIAVPSGSRVRVQYEVGRPPILAVRIQEIFGLRETPRIAGGRVPVLLHLLGPNQRPQQITDDLASFWARGYPEIRKELRRRYPKHSWPEDPLAAAPQARPGRAH